MEWRSILIQTSNAVQNKCTERHTYAKRNSPQPNLAQDKSLATLNDRQKGDIRGHCREWVPCLAVLVRLLGVKDGGAGNTEEANAPERE